MTRKSSSCSVVHSPYSSNTSSPGGVAVRQEAEILFLPYNYLLSAESQMAMPTNFKWEQAILIFDEAHNLESSCMEAASVEISTMLIQHCIR
jgi:Rad3-related DNA helicase